VFDNQIGGCSACQCVVCVPATLRSCERPPGLDRNRNPSQPEAHRRIAEIGKHTIGDPIAHYHGEIIDTGNASEHVARHLGGPLPRRKQFDVTLVIERLPAAGYPLREIDQVRGDIGDAFTLHGDIENPGRPH
jgi:hypothetical protein